MELRGFIAALACGLVVGCGGGGGGGGSGALPAPTGLSVDYDVKAYAFSWDAVGGATHYQVSEDLDGPGPEGASVVGGQITGTTFKLTHGTLLHRKLNAQYTVRACDGSACGAPASVQPDVARAIGYFKASNTDPADGFGWNVALSADGHTLAVSAPAEDGAGQGIGADPHQKGESGAGAVFVFSRSGPVWVQQAYLKGHNTESGDNFGNAMALSADGNTLAVAAFREDSTGSGINDFDAPEGAVDANSGAVYVFVRSAGSWSQQAYIKASHPDSLDQFGQAVALSGDGNTLAVGVPQEDSAVSANPDDDLADAAGSVYVFARDNAIWTQQAYLKAGKVQAGDWFGVAVSLSGDGNSLAVGAFHEDSSETGTEGSDTNDGAPNSGAAYVFTRGNGVWTQKAYIKASNTQQSDEFGLTLAISEDGKTLAVGSPRESSSAKGVNGDQANDEAFRAGAVYVFALEATGWRQQAYLKASNTSRDQLFGVAVSVSADGSTLAVGAFFESSQASGIDGDQLNTSAPIAGAVYFFDRTGVAWGQQAYLKPSNTSPYQYFGGALALSSDGKTLAIGARGEASSARGIGGNQADRSMESAGAVYLY